MLADAGGGYYHSLMLIGLFGVAFCDNIKQILIGPALKEGPQLIWANTIKDLLAKIWFERNQSMFHDKQLGWMDCFEVAVLKAPSWCTLSKLFKDFSIQDLYLNWHAFIFPN